MEETMKAYLAGCLDCDGYFTIKRSTYHMRVRHDAGQPIFSEKIGLKQVTPDVPGLLRFYFGGYRRIEKPTAKHGRCLFAWSITDRKAIECIRVLLPYLRVKRKQAELLLELRALKNTARIQDGTFVMANRWGHKVTMPRRVVNPIIIEAKESLFNQIKQLNDSRTTKPVLI